MKSHNFGLRPWLGVASCKGVACLDNPPLRADLLLDVQTLHGQPDVGGDLIVPPTASHQGLYLGMWQTALHSWKLADVPGLV